MRAPILLITLLLAGKPPHDSALGLPKGERFQSRWQQKRSGYRKERRVREMKKSVGMVMAGLVALVVSVVASYGALIPLSVYREAGVSGEARNAKGTYVEKYGSVANKSGGGEFEASLSGKANGNNPVVAWPAEGSQRAASTSSVTSFVGEDLITSEGRMGVDTRVPYSGPPYGVSVARAWSVFEMSFLVEEALFWELDIDVSVGNDFGRIRPEFEFSSLGGGDVLSPLQESFLGKGLVSYSGIFLPDIYTFRLNSETWASIDPAWGFGNSPLEPMLQAIRNVEITDRSICLPDLLAVSRVRPYSFGSIG
jgi:hypothetical protein